MRLPAGVPGRMVVTDLKGATTTWLDGRHLLAATATPTLNGPCQITADVRSSDPAVNVLFTDGDPLVAQSNRLVYMFLRYGLPDVDPWNLVASGILMSPQDQADSDIGTTHFTAYDGWQWLMGLPVFLDNEGTALTPEGVILTGAGNVIAMTALGNSLQSLIALGMTGPGYGMTVPGFGLVDLPAEYGGAASSGFWAGTNEATPDIAVQAQQGMTIGDLFTQLSSMGGDVTGTSQCIDIWAKPIYDPVNRPGYVSEINIFNLMGQQRPGSAFTWARFNRTAVTADREHDGTPGSFINVANFFAGQGGWPVLPIPQDAASIAAAYSYWSQQFFADQFATGEAVLFLANQALTLYKQGKRTFAVDPDPMRAPRPGVDYQIGDRVLVYAPGARPFGTQPYGLRAEAAGYQRVQSIPIQLNADGVTMVSKLLTSPDWPQGSSVSDLTPTAGPAGLTGVEITATGFLPSTALTVTVGGVMATVTAGGTTDSTGYTVVTFTIPGSLSTGSHAVVVSDGTNTITSPQNFQVGSTVYDLEPTYGPAGTTGVQITAQGFLPTTALTVTVGGDSATVTAGGTTDVDGNSVVTFTIPGGLADGYAPVVVTDGTNTATSPVPFDVGTTPPPPTGRSFTGGWWTTPLASKTPVANSADWISRLIDAGVTGLFVNTDEFTPAWAQGAVGVTTGWAYGTITTGDDSYHLPAASPYDYTPTLDPDWETAQDYNPDDTDNGFLITDEANAVNYEVGGQPGLIAGPAWNTGADSGGSRPFPIADDGWVNQQNMVNGIAGAAAGCSNLGGIMFQDEIDAGPTAIPHRLVCAIPGNLIRGPSNSPVYPGPLVDAGAYIQPATRSDGSAGQFTDNIPMGSIFTYPDDFDITTLSSDPYVLGILAGIQQNGMVLVNSTGGSAITLYAVHVCSPSHPTYPSSILGGIPGAVENLIIVTPPTAPIYSS